MSDNPQPLPPGLHPDVPMSEYLQIDAVSNSRLKRMGLSPAHYQFHEPHETKAMEFGTYSHCALLTPFEFADLIAVLPDLVTEVQAAQVANGKQEYKVPKASKAYKDAVASFAEANQGRRIMEQEAYHDAQKMYKRLRENDLARRWLNADGDNETTIIWDHPGTGLRCKGRLDMMRGGVSLGCTGLVVDYKTTSSLFGFEREIHKYGYHRQLAMYQDAVEIITGKPCVAGIIAQESSQPFCARAALLSDDTLAIGRAAYNADLVRLKACIESGEWPGPDNPEQWELPGWAMVQGETTTVDFSGVPSEDPREPHERVGF